MTAATRTSVLKRSGVRLKGSGRCRQECRRPSCGCRAVDAPGEGRRTDRGQHQAQPQQRLGSHDGVAESRIDHGQNGDEARGERRRDGRQGARAQYLLRQRIVAARIDLQVGQERVDLAAPHEAHQGERKDSHEGHDETRGPDPRWPAHGRNSNVKSGDRKMSGGPQSRLVAENTRLRPRRESRPTRPRRRAFTVNQPDAELDAEAVWRHRRDMSLRWWPVWASPGSVAVLPLTRAPG